MNKIVSVVFCFLLVSSMLIFPIQSDASQQDEIIYVDVDNTDGPWDGSFEHPFQYIQDGINAARRGYTVFVCKGHYEENLVVFKSIILKGEDKASTIIDGGNKCSTNLIQVFARNVEITGFSIQNGRNQGIFEDAAGIQLLFSGNNDIHDNLFTNNDIGIHFYRSHKNTILNNSIINNTYGICSGCLNMYGLVGLGHSRSNKIIHNNISNNAISLDLGCVSYSEIHQNKFFENRLAMRLSNSRKNTIKNNSICSNTDYGILLSFCHNNVIKYNIISDNQKIGLRLSGSKNNLIKFNNFSKNNRGIYLKYGDISLIVFNCKKNKVINNNFLDNEEHVTFINGIFKRNRFVGNYWDGSQSNPYIIHGFISFFDYIPDYISFFPRIDVPWIKFDWHPASEPYDIDGGERL